MDSCLPVQNLRRKAEQRNPDEFYFAMERKRTKGGVVASRSVCSTQAFWIPAVGLCSTLYAVFLSCYLCLLFFTYSITEANKYTQEELCFMKSQDASYLALKAQTEMKVCLLACNNIG